MLAYVPVRFDLYRPLKPHLRWTLQCLVSFADHAGKCWPSVRKLGAVAGLSKSTVSRHLAELARMGIVARQRRPGGVYVYTIDARFLPPAAKLSRMPVPAVPPGRTEEKIHKKKEIVVAEFKDLPAQAPWEQRVHGYLARRFWLPAWGNRPDEPGCQAPHELLSRAEQGSTTLRQ